MKALSLILSLILIISFAGCGKTVPDDASDSSPVAGSQTDQPYEKEEEAPEYLIDYTSYEMTLVNPWTPLEEGFKPELSKIDSQYCSVELSFASVAIDSLHAMCRAATSDGVDLKIISAWRSTAVQTSLFNNKVDRVLKANPSLSLEEAKAEAGTAVAVPGTSEHQLGLAVDFNSVEDSFRNTDEYKWLVEHCTDYGFILRYTAEKSSITGIIPEPWHYRYVGVENAKMIEKSGLCLEEFIEKYNTFE